MAALEVCGSTWCFNCFWKLLKTCNIKVGLESIYTINWELCVRPAVGALDDGWVDLFPVGKSVKAVGTEGVKASEELGLVGVVIVGLLTDATVLKFLWDIGVGMKVGHVNVALKKEVYHQTLWRSEVCSFVPWSETMHKLWATGQVPK